MADGVNEPSQVVRASDEHTADTPMGTAVGIGGRGEAGRHTASPHAQKFRVTMAALVGLAIGALVVALALASSTGGSTSKQMWSDWSPPDNGIQGAREIADHLAPLYRISALNQLDVVTVSNINNSPSTATSSSAASSSTNNGLQVAVRNDPSSSAVSLIGGNTIAYNLCGIGSSNCAIGVGAPSADRLLLLRREALELALYTFKYVSGTQNVVAILPPGHTTQASTLTARPPSPGSKPVTKPLNVALLFLKDELSPWLAHPLSATFPEQFPPTVPELALWKQSTEAALVEQVTARGMFSEHLVQAQDGSNLLVLDPLPPS
jgi:hypothetical protein